MSASSFPILDETFYFLLLFFHSTFCNFSTVWIILLAVSLRETILKGSFGLFPAFKGPRELQCHLTFWAPPNTVMNWCLSTSASVSVGLLWLTVWFSGSSCLLQCWRCGSSLVFSIVVIMLPSLWLFMPSCWFLAGFIAVIDLSPSSQVWGLVMRHFCLILLYMLTVGFGISGLIAVWFSVQFREM